MRNDYRIRFVVIAYLIATACLVSTFWLPTTTVGFLGHQRRNNHRAAYSYSSSTTALASGYGIATNYTWKEEAYELDVTVRVPTNTRAKDIIFKATSTSVDLRLKTSTSTSSTTGDDSYSENESIAVLQLLDPSRKLRGRVNVDGTYWVISDPDDSGAAASAAEADYRQVTVTIEKLIRTPKDDFEIVDYDWKGVYSTEDADEVKERKYDAAEPLDVRQYAAKMGVDIDNINMSMVDKSMFSSGLNLTQSTLNELNEAGYLTQEVTQQADGTEYIVNDDGEAVPFSATTGQIKDRKKPVPFLDTDSPWNKAITVDAVRETNETVVQQTRNFTRAAFAEDSAKDAAAVDINNPFKKKNNAQTAAEDPIDALTVARLKEILKAQGLKSSGTKGELQDRLRNQVNALLQGKQQDKP